MHPVYLDYAPKYQEAHSSILYTKPNDPQSTKGQSGLCGPQRKLSVSSIFTKGKPLSWTCTKTLTMSGSLWTDLQLKQCPLGARLERLKRHLRC